MLKPFFLKLPSGEIINPLSIDNLWTEDNTTKVLFHSGKVTNIKAQDVPTLMTWYDRYIGAHNGVDTVTSASEDLAMFS